MLSRRHLHKCGSPLVLPHHADQTRNACRLYCACLQDSSLEVSERVLVSSHGEESDHPWLPRVNLSVPAGGHICVLPLPRQISLQECRQNISKQDPHPQKSTSSSINKQLPNEDLNLNNREPHPNTKAHTAYLLMDILEFAKYTSSTRNKTHKQQTSPK